MLAWGDESVEKAREIVKKAKAEEAALNQERLEWEKAVIKGDDVGPVRHSPKPNSEKLREPNGRETIRVGKRSKRVVDR